MSTFLHKTFLGAAAALTLGAGMAGAATFSFTGTGDTTVLSGYDLLPDLDGIMIDLITGDEKSSSNGLSITGPGKLTYTYLGFEASNSNYSTNLGLTTFINGVTTIGTTASFTQLIAGLMSFGFGTSAPHPAVGVITNDGDADPASVNYAIGYYKISDTAYYLLFDDIASGDRDFDDLGLRVELAPIPLPAGGLLLIGALGGLALLRRRKAA